MPLFTTGPSIKIALMKQDLGSASARISSSSITGNNYSSIHTYICPPKWPHPIQTHFPILVCQTVGGPQRACPSVIEFVPLVLRGFTQRKSPALHLLLLPPQHLAHVFHHLHASVDDTFSYHWHQCHNCSQEVSLAHCWTHWKVLSPSQPIS